MTLPRVVLNFEYKNFIPNLNYVALSQVWAIQDIIFETSFWQDHFLEMPIPLIRRKTTKDLARIYDIVEYLERSITQYQEESIQLILKILQIAVCISSISIN